MAYLLSADYYNTNEQMNELRKALGPDLITAENRYPVVLAAIEQYTINIDKIGDEDLSLYRKLENYLHCITGKDMSRFNLYAILVAYQ